MIKKGKYQHTLWTLVDIGRFLYMHFVVETKLNVFITYKYNVLSTYRLLYRTGLQCTLLVHSIIYLHSNIIYGVLKLVISSDCILYTVYPSRTDFYFWTFYLTDSRLFVNIFSKFDLTLLFEECTLT